MKEKLTNNIGLKILSIILAAILWLVITNIDNPKETRPFKNVPVVVLNEKVITALGKTYDIKKGSTVNFTIRAKRAIRDDLENSDFVVTADLSQLSITNSVNIEITCPEYGDQVEIIEGKFQTMEISLENLSTQNKKITIIERGEAAEGYHVVEKIASPNMISVSGPESKVNEIAQVVAEVNVNGVTKSFSTTSKLKILDQNGNEIENLTVNVEEVDINITVYRTKEIRLLFTVSGLPAYGYGLKEYTWDPKVLEIAGTQEALKNINYLPIEYNITDAKENIEETIDLLEHLPEDVYLVGEDSTVGVTIFIEKKVTKDINVFPGNVKFRKKPENLRLTYNDSTTPILISLIGLEEDLKTIDKDNISLYVDLADYQPGTYVTNISLDNAGKDIALVNKPTVNFNLSEVASTD